MGSKKKLTLAGILVMCGFIGLSFGLSDLLNPYDSGLKRILIAGAIPAVGGVLGACIAAILGLTEPTNEQDEM